MLKMIINYNSLFIWYNILFFFITNNRIYKNYINFFDSNKILLTQNNNVLYNLETITSDSELVLIEAINKTFPKGKKIVCYYHHINDIKKIKSIYI